MGNKGAYLCFYVFETQGLGDESNWEGKKKVNYNKDINSVFFPNKYSSKKNSVKPGDSWTNEFKLLESIILALKEGIGNANFNSITNT